MAISPDDLFPPFIRIAPEVCPDAAANRSTTSKLDDTNTGGVFSGAEVFAGTFQTSGDADWFSARVFGDRILRVSAVDRDGLLTDLVLRIRDAFGRELPVDDTLEARDIFVSVASQSGAAEKTPSMPDRAMI